MLKVIFTNVVVSKGYDNAPAIRYSEKGDSVRFRIGAKQYDTRAENNTRWINLSVKAFAHICERIRKMDLKEGSYINLVGVWTKIAGRIRRLEKPEARWSSFWMM